MNILMDTIHQALAGYLWPFCRIAAVLSTMTAIGSQSVPARIRLFLAVAMTVALAPLIDPPPSIPLLSVPGFLVTLMQVVIGIAMGFVLLIVLQTFTFAGYFIGMQTSLGFAAMVDPSNGQQVPVVGHVYQLLTLLLFFTFDVHLVVFQMLFYSFETLPIGLEGIAPANLNSLAKWGQTIFTSGFMIALSAVIALLMINFSFGVMTRASPQLNIFSIGFPMVMLAGLFVLWLTIFNVFDYFPVVWLQGKQLICTMLYQSCH